MDKLLHSLQVYVEKLIKKGIIDKYKSNKILTENKNNMKIYNVHFVQATRI